jgi:hypothetical protein
MNIVRLILWPFAFAHTLIAKARRAEAERERAMLRAAADDIAAGLAGGFSVSVAESSPSRGPLHYWPEAGNPIVACEKWIEPGVWHTSDVAKVTCPDCRRVLVEAMLITPDDIAAREVR